MTLLYFSEKIWKSGPRSDIPNVEEALQLIFEPSQDSDLEGLSDSDNEDEIPDQDANFLIDEIEDDIEETDGESDETMTNQETAETPINPPELPTQKSNSQIPSTSSKPGPSTSQRTTRSQIDPSTCSSTNQIVSEDPSSDTDPEYLFDSEDEIIIEENLRKHKCRWRHVAPPSATVEFTGAEFSVPPDNFDSLSPHDIFSTFWSNEITQLIVEQTNLYSVLKNGQSVKTVIHEMEHSFWECK